MRIIRIIFLFSIVILLSVIDAGAVLPTLVIDPGHSPKQPGATSCTGKTEYVYNLALADVVVKYLRELGLQVTLTHRPDQEMSLKMRAASATGKSLLLSIHHDSIQPSFLSYANGMPFSNKAEGYSIFVSRANRYYLQSLQYARVLGRELQKRKLKPSHYHAEDIRGERHEVIDTELGIYEYGSLAILKGANAPAILLEAAVIVHPEDERRASSPVFQKTIAEAITETILTPSR